ncbi:hypothetical protein QQX98_012097 [Neonectria punicea]|uniref:Uncharacterized protein n=1 Tax=Neonectria punicea TaxID=979145 RepID=A0ABR1GK32_9HYPO
MTAYVTQNEVALEPLASRHNHSGETLEGQETVYFLQLLGKQSFSSAYGRTYASFLPVFVSAGWLSMLYEPSHRHTTGVFSIRGLPRQSITRIQQNIDPCLQRPLSSVSLGFGRLLPTMHIDAAEGQTNRLQVSMLAFDTLMRMGKVRINWSDSLGSHLQFDPIRRELTLFRLPSYCALCLESQDQFTLFER